MTPRRSNLALISRSFSYHLNTEMDPTTSTRQSSYGPIVPDDTVLPPPQPGVRYVRVPVKCVIVISDDHLRDRVDRFFYWPMIILALLMLPLLAWEFLAAPQWGTWQWWVSALALALIWVAFFLEFVIKIAIAESRFEYIKRNWLDLIILALPLMRPLRIASLARTSRIFTLRGVSMKFIRYVAIVVVGLKATDRLLERAGVKTRKGRRDPREMTRHELMREVQTLRRLADQWSEWFDQHQEHLLRHGTCAPFREPPPSETMPTNDSTAAVPTNQSSLIASNVAKPIAQGHSLDPMPHADTVNRPG